MAMAAAVRSRAGPSLPLPTAVPAPGWASLADPDDVDMTLATAQQWEGLGQGVLRHTPGLQSQDNLKRADKIW